MFTQLEIGEQLAQSEWLVELMDAYKEPVIDRSINYSMHALQQTRTRLEVIHDVCYALIIAVLMCIAGLQAPFLLFRCLLIVRTRYVDGEQLSQKVESF